MKPHGAGVCACLYVCVCVWCWAVRELTSSSRWEGQVPSIDSEVANRHREVDYNIPTSRTPMTSVLSWSNDKSRVKVKIYLSMLFCWYHCLYIKRTLTVYTAVCVVLATNALFKYLTFL